MVGTGMVSSQPVNSTRCFRSGQSMDAVLTARVFEPLGMKETAFVLTPAMRSRRASMHRRDRSGAVTAIDFELPENPEVFMGGGALFGSAADYMRFLRMWLNDGAGERGRVLRAETVALAARPLMRTTLAPSVAAISVLTPRSTPIHPDLHLMVARCVRRLIDKPQSAKGETDFHQPSRQGDG